MSMGTTRRRVTSSTSAAAVAALAAMVGAWCAASPARADNWPAFRGADGRSVSGEKGLPVEWGPEENVRWQIALPGRSNGSPIVWGDRVFLAQADGASNRRTVMCFDRAGGKLLWQSGITYAEKETAHPDNPYCSGTPVTDGERVVASFGSAGLYCYDFAGKELWHRDLGKLEHMFGNAISPVIVGDLVVLNFGPGVGARLVAVDKRTGEIAWEQQPPKVDPGEQRLAGPRLAGPAAMFAMPFVGQGDKDDDAALTRDEMVALADKWFDKLDAEKAGKVTAEQLAARLNGMLSAPGGPGGPDAGKILGPGLFAATDANNDGSLTRDEFVATFGGWHGKWAGEKGEPVDANQVLDGLNVIFPPPEGARGFGGATGPGGSWSTPILVRANGRDELVIAFPNRLAGYDPKTGAPLWFSRDLKDSIQPMPLWDEAAGAIIASSSDMAGGAIVAVKPGGSGDVTESHRLWRLPRVKGGIGTGVVHDGRFYSVSADGFAACYDLKTGKRLWQKRLEAAGDKGSSWSSMLLADGKIYAPNQSGDVFVLKAAGEFELLATNSVDEPTNASLAASDGDLFLRTDKSLWCIGNR
jgi:outer membrane protein assembly factor BamB